MEYTVTHHIGYTVIGLITMGIILFSIKTETDFLYKYRQYKFQFALSLLSIFVMIVLSLTLLGHWFIPQIVTMFTLMILGPFLLILAPVILWLRARTFRGLERKWRKEQDKLITEIEDIIDEKKRERIMQGKSERGED
ncbi:MAG TPA: hypothetical protein VGB30_00595 [bacterium]|jgi:hypothetical protein